ncbi:unnamed protein product, partial [Choristocarpus tenellus]
MSASIDDYDVGQELGRGGFAIVYRARVRSTGREVALKVIDKEKVALPGGDASLTSRIANEVRLHWMLKHPAVVELLDFFEDTRFVYLALELCGGGDLYRHLKSRGSLSEAEVAGFMGQILAGLAFLHSRGILHRDLKLSNLLLSQDRRRLRISDFGLAVMLEDNQEERHTICGTPNYMAPEVQSAGYGLSADIWSAGCLFYTMVTGGAPFQGQRVGDTLSNARCGQYLEPDGLSSCAKDFLRCMLQLDPLQRLSVENIASHPFLSLDRSTAAMEETSWDNQPPETFEVVIKNTNAWSNRGDVGRGTAGTKVESHLIEVGRTMGKGTSPLSSPGMGYSTLTVSTAATKMDRLSTLPALLDSASAKTVPEGGDVDFSPGRGKLSGGLDGDGLRRNGKVSCRNWGTGQEQVDVLRGGDSGGCSGSTTRLGGVQGHPEGCVKDGQVWNRKGEKMSLGPLEHSSESSNSISVRWDTSPISDVMDRGRAANMNDECGGMGPLDSSRGSGREEGRRGMLQSQHTPIGFSSSPHHSSPIRPIPEPGSDCRHPNPRKRTDDHVNDPSRMPLVCCVENSRHCLEFAPGLEAPDFPNASVSSCRRGTTYGSIEWGHGPQIPHPVPSGQKVPIKDLRSERKKRSGVRGRFPEDASFSVCNSRRRGVTDDNDVTRRSCPCGRTLQLEAQTLTGPRGGSVNGRVWGEEKEDKGRAYAGHTQDRSSAVTGINRQRQRKRRGRWRGGVRSSGELAVGLSGTAGVRRSTTVGIGKLGEKLGCQGSAGAHESWDDQTSDEGGVSMPQSRHVSRRRERPWDADTETSPARPPAPLPLLPRQRLSEEVLGSGENTLDLRELQAVASALRCDNEPGCDVAAAAAATASSLRGIREGGVQVE